MFRFDILKPEIKEEIQDKEVSKETFRQVLFYNLLELERLRLHMEELEFEINEEGDLYLLLGLGERRIFTKESIGKKKELIRRILPLIIKIILEEYLAKKDIDRWDSFILFGQKGLEDFLSGKISYNELITHTLFS